MKTSTLMLKEIWKKTLNCAQQSNKIDDVVFENFYIHSKLHALTDSKAIVTVPSFIHKSILLQELSLLENCLQTSIDATKKIPMDIVLESDIDTIVVERKEIITDANYLSQPILEDRTFENFIVGNSNRESHSAALACAYNPGKFFNPLFIYGNSGLGKSHLLQSIGNYILAADPSKQVYYTDSTRFIENVAESIKKNEIDKFKKLLYNVDCLLIDDIQMLGGKEKSHEVFFNIFNELVNNRKQICIVSDRLPTEIKGLEDRLISRFSSGLSVTIDSPEFETAVAILKSKLKNSGFDINSLDDEILSFIASNFSKDVRQLEGALNRVLFYAIQFQSDKGKISFETASNALKNQAVSYDKTTLTPKKIIKIVADYYGLTKQQLISKTRTKNISNARQIAMYLCRKHLDIPYLKIGEEFGNRDHSTVISSCDKVEKSLKINFLYANAIDELEKMLKS